MDIRPFIIEALNKKFEERWIFANAQSGGKATIDINVRIPESWKTVTKAHGIERFLDITGMNPNVCVFMGDDLHDNSSNDYPVLGLRDLWVIINVIDQKQTQKLFNHILCTYKSSVNHILDDEHVIISLSSQDSETYCIQLLDNTGVIFSDLDETLIPSKTIISPDMAVEISRLLAKKQIVVITGGLFQTIKKNLLDWLPPGTNFSNLTFLPILGNEIWLYNSISWEYELFSEKKEAVIGMEDIQILEDAIEKAINNFWHPDHLFGDMIEKRWSRSVLSISVSYFGQTVPKKYEHLKKEWDISRSKRTGLIELIKSYIPPHMLEVYDFQIGGSTSIDIIKKWFDKSTGIKHYLSSDIHPGIDKKDMVAIGDSCDINGNDYPMSKVVSNLIHVLSPDDTYQLFSKI